MEIRVEWDARGLDAFKRATDVLGTAKTRQILHFTLDQVGGKCNTEIKRALAKETGLPVGVVAKGLKQEKSSPAKLEYKIIGTGKHFGLAAFGAHQFKAGARAHPWGKTRTFPGTFVIEQFGGEVFKHGEGRSIVKLWGPSIPREMARDAIAKVAFKTFADRELPRAIDTKLRQYIP